MSGADNSQKKDTRGFDSTEINHPFIEKLEVIDSEVLIGKEISFNSDLNTLIGTPGSGKSTLIELLRYGLGLEPLADKRYKNSLVSHVLGSNGKIFIDIVIKKERYRVERIYGDLPRVYKGDEFLPYLDIRDIFPVIYYGQKDLQNFVETQVMKMKLLDRYLEESLKQIERELEELAIRLREIINKHNLSLEKLNWLEEIKREKARIDERLKYFDENNLTEFFRTEVAFKQGAEFFDVVLTYLTTQTQIVTNCKEQLFENLMNLKNHLSDDYNIELIKKVKARLNQYNYELKDWIEKYSDTFEQYSKELSNSHSMFLEIRKNAIEKMGTSIERIELDSNLSTEAYFDLLKRKNYYDFILSNVESTNQSIKKINQTKWQIYQAIQEARELIFALRYEEAEKINILQNLVKIDVNYQGDKVFFAKTLNLIFQGSEVSQSKLQLIANEFSNGIDIFKALQQKERFEKFNFSDEEWEVFVSRAIDQEEVLTLTQIPDTIQITYKGVEFDLLSLGQRASAIIMMLLIFGDQPIIIDQPEDDLDTQTLYQGLIKELLDSKGNRQFIFSTHNPNIPVIGSSEQIIVCQYRDGKISTEQGAIESSDIQKHIIDIMEGGNQAFTKRKEVYEEWMS